MSTQKQTSETDKNQDIMFNKEDRQTQQRENKREEGKGSTIQLGNQRIDLNPDGTYRDKNQLIDKMSEDSFPASDPPSTY